MRRQTPRTMGPWAAIRTASACPSRWARKRSRSARSSRPATVPRCRSCSIDRNRTACSLDMARPPTCLTFPPSYCEHTGRLFQLSRISSRSPNSRSGFFRVQSIMRHGLSRRAVGQEETQLGSSAEEFSDDQASPGGFARNRAGGRPGGDGAGPEGQEQEGPGSRRPARFQLGGRGRQARELGASQGQRAGWRQ